MGYRWARLGRVLSEKSSTLPSLKQFQLINYSSQFVGQVLPFLAADALRIVYARTAGMSLRSAVLATTFDRAVALLSLIGLCIIGLVVSPWIGDLTGFRPTVAALGMLSLAGLGFALVFGDKVASLLPNKSVFRAVADLLRSFRRLSLDPKAVTPILILAVSVHGLSIAIFWLLCIAEGLSVSAGEMLTIVPLLLLATALPISIAGWGVREGLAVVLFSNAGLSSEAAFAASLAFGAVILLAAAPGMVTMLMVTKEATLQPSSLRTPNT